MDKTFGTMHDEWDEPRFVGLESEEAAEAHILAAHGPDSGVYVVKVERVTPKAKAKAKASDTSGTSAKK